MTDFLSPRREIRKTGRLTGGQGGNEGFGETGARQAIDRRNPASFAPAQRNQG